MTNALLAFFGGDPVIAWTLTFACVFVIGALVMFARSRYQARQRDREDARFRLKMRALIEPPEPIQWPRPAKPKGWQTRGHRRAS